MSAFKLRAMLPQLLGRGLDSARAVISFLAFGLSHYQRVTFESDLINGMRTTKMATTCRGMDAPGLARL